MEPVKIHINVAIKESFDQLQRPNLKRLLQFRNCRILRDHKIISEDFWVRDGKIVDPEKVFFDEKISADVQIDCKGALISPGFIELQINGKILPLLKKHSGGLHGAAVLGVHLEGPFINPKKKGAHPEDCIQGLSKGFMSLQEIYGTVENVRIVTLAPELENAAQVINELTKRGITVSLGKTSTVYENSSSCRNIYIYIYTQ
ncbi:N-acetylglucosamine-6-phosphate deacetylase [Blattella germanica]|nr:N-acetylglucosamine-6-phosphate deacetylase [Blattella germanica]